MTSRLTVWVVVVWAMLWGMGLGAASMAAEKELPAAPELLAPYVRELEEQIAARIVRRPNTQSINQTQLEMEIDVRVITRWMLMQAMEASPGSELQSAAYLRGLQMLDAIGGFNEALGGLAGTDIGKIQTDAMKRLHDMSFVLAPAKNVTTLDNVSAQFGAAMLAVIHPDANPGKLPVMRPRPRSGGESQADSRLATLAQLEQQARQATVSVPLRQQLLALWAEAVKAQQNSAQSELAEQLLETLRSAVGIARGLEMNTGVSLDQRQRIEEQLLEAIALYLDRRTQAAGLARIQGMRTYQRLLGRVDELGLSVEQRQAVGPALAYAQENPGSARQVLGALERFAETARRFAALSNTPNSIANLRGATTELRRQYQEMARAFLVSAGQYSKQFDVSPGDFEAAATAQRDVVALLEALDRMPRVIEVLTAFKPRKLAQLERRILTAATAAADLQSDAGKASASALRGVSDLASLAVVLDQRAVQTGTPVGDYLAGGIETLDGRWRSAISEQASNFAGGGTVDGGVLTQLQWLVEIYDAIGEAAPAEKAVAQTHLLMRWVDWNLPAPVLETVLSPYRRSTVRLAGLVLQGAKPADFAAWNRLRRAYAPIIAMLSQSGAYADEVAAFPDGFTGQVAMLLTPMNDAAFGMQRYASAALAIWASKINNGQDKLADAARDLIMARLARMVGEVDRSGGAAAGGSGGGAAAPGPATVPSETLRRVPGDGGRRPRGQNEELNIFQ